MAFPFIYIAIIFGWTLLIIAYFSEDYAIAIMSGFFLMILGITILTNGIEGIYSWSNFAVETFGIIHIAVGGIVAISKGIELIKS